MTKTLHVGYEMMDHEEAIKIVEEAMGIAREEIPNLPR